MGRALDGVHRGRRSRTFDAVGPDEGLDESLAPLAVRLRPVDRIRDLVEMLLPRPCDADEAGAVAGIRDVAEVQRALLRLEVVADEGEHRAADDRGLDLEPRC